jgi:hypothetical protein
MGESEVARSKRKREKEEKRVGMGQDCWDMDAAS